MSECLSFSRILRYSRGDGEVSAAEADHLRSCSQCEEQLKLASDDGLLEKQLREAEHEVGRFVMTSTSTIGDYELVREIGRGGMGVVYEAVQRSLNRRVALKVLPALLHSLRPESGARFKAEAAAAARLQHPHIVPIYDYGRQEGCHYYAMELIRGVPLSEIIKEKSQSAEAPGLKPGAALRGEASRGLKPAARDRDYFRRVARWIAEVAQALQFAHDQGVIHRDIKPNNLILCETGRVMISDFGLAKDLNEEAPAAQAPARSGQLMGTWQYMSPEQVRAGGAKVDHRTDIYSLGATLYELLTFQAAIPGGGDHEMLQKVLEHEPIPPRKIIAQIPNDLGIICTKAMSKEAGERYQTAAEMSADLRRFLNDESIQARRPELHVRLIKYVRRHRFTVTLGLVGVFLATSVISTAAYLDLARERAELQNAMTAQLVTAARKLLDAEQYNMAASVYSNVLTRDSNLAYVYASRALAYGELGRFDEAIDDLSSAIELSPQHSGPYFRRGVLHLIHAANDAAQADFERAISSNANDDQARVFRFFSGRPAAQSQIQYDELLYAGRDTPIGVDYFGRLASYLDNGGDPAAAIEAASTPKARALVYCALAEQAFLNGDSDRAREWYSKSIEANNTPNVVRLYCKKQLERCNGG